MDREDGNHGGPATILPSYTLTEGARIISGIKPPETKAVLLETKVSGTKFEEPTFFSVRLTAEVIPISSRLKANK